jgi:hypothetical protein
MLASILSPALRSYVKPEEPEPVALRSEMDYACSGTLHSRTKVCGRATCPCATDVTARHGPYDEWSRRKDGRLVHSVLSPEQAALIQRGIANRRHIDHLLARWEDETAHEVLRPKAGTT